MTTLSTIAVTVKPKSRMRGGSSNCGGGSGGGNCGNGGGSGCGN